MRYIKRKTVGIAPQAKRKLYLLVLTLVGAIQTLAYSPQMIFLKRKDIDIVSMSLSTTFSEARWYQKEALHKAVKACTDNNIAVMCSETLEKNRIISLFFKNLIL